MLAILYYLFCLSQNLRAAAINLGMQALPGSLSAKTQSAFFRKRQYLRKFFSCPEENLVLSLVLFRQRSPRYRMTNDGAKNVAVCLFTIYFRITPLFYLDLVAFSLFSITHNVKAAIYGQKLHTKKVRIERIFFVYAKNTRKEIKSGAFICVFCWGI